MDDWLPSLNALRAFEATARHRSFSQAAEELSVTPAAVKQLVTKLEQVIGEPLVSRKGHQMEVTRTGAAGYAELRGAFQQITLAVERMRAETNGDRLVVSVDPSFASAWLVPRLEAFKAANPKVEVLVDSSMRIANLRGGTADIGIRFGVADHGDLVSHRLFDERLCALCSPVLAAETTSVNDLADAMLLRWDLSEFAWAENTRRWNFWRTWLEAAGAKDVKPGNGAIFNDYNLALQAAIAGQGFIIGSAPILDNVIKAQILVDPFGISVETGIGYDVVTTREAIKRPPVKSFFDWIVAQASGAL